MFTFFKFPSSLHLQESTQVIWWWISYTHHSHTACREAEITPGCVVALHVAMNSSQDPSQPATKKKKVPGPPNQGPKAKPPAADYPPGVGGVGVCVGGGCDCLLRQRTKCGHQSRFQRGLKEGIGQDPPQCPHSCQGIISGRMTQKVPDIEKVSGTNPPLVPNGISFQHPNSTAPPFYCLQSTYLLSEILLFLSLLSVVVLPTPLYPPS